MQQHLANCALACACECMHAHREQETAFHATHRHAALSIRGGACAQFPNDFP